MSADDTNDVIPLSVTSAELATVLAALRYYQQRGMGKATAP